jgi:molecular chaperone DnaK
VLESTNKEDIDAKAQKLSESMMKLGEAIYKAQQSAPQGETGSAQAAGEEQANAAGTATGDVVDAQFEDVSDDKKD